MFGLKGVNRMKQMAIKRMSLLSSAAESFGFNTVEDMYAAAVCDSVVPGICKRCGTSVEIEPDSRDGWCDECEANTVVSVLVLGGLI